MPDDCSVSPIMGCHLLSSTHKSNCTCVCVLQKERESQRKMAFWVCEVEEDRTDSGRKLGRRRMDKTQPTS